MDLAKYPAFSDLSEEQRLVCQWEGCKAKRAFKNLTTLRQHLEKVHQVDSDDLKGH